MGDGLLAAIRRFPERRTAIETMIVRDEEFRLLCEDLAEAEAALAEWRKSEAQCRDQRLAEYDALVVGLAAEMKEALDASSVVPFRSDRRQPPDKR